MSCSERPYLRKFCFFGEVAKMNDFKNDHKESAQVGCGQVVFALAFGGALVYFGGWSVAWGVLHYPFKPIVFSEEGVLIRFNELYYGVVIVDRFFDSPIISWVCGLLAAGCVCAPFSGGDEKKS